jgi:hypothetical protein
VKSKPKNKWHLFSVAISAEVANQYMQTAKTKAKLEGNDRAEFAIRIFESSFHIPEFMNEIKDQKPMFN